MVERPDSRNGPTRVAPSPKLGPGAVAAGRGEPRRRPAGPSPLSRVHQASDVKAVPTQAPRRSGKTCGSPLQVADDATRRRFWRSHVALGFTVLAGESAAALVYFLRTPEGAHRHALVIVALASITVGGTGIRVAGWVSEHTWRTSFVLLWSIASGLTLAASAALDGGLESP